MGALPFFFFLKETLFYKSFKKDTGTRHPRHPKTPTKEVFLEGNAHFYSLFGYFYSLFGYFYSLFGYFYSLFGYFYSLFGYFYSLFGPTNLKKFPHTLSGIRKLKRSFV